MYRPLHPLNSVFLAGTIPLFLGALLSDIAYALSYELQWKNFASWLIVGGLVFGGVSLTWAIVDLFRAGPRGPRIVIHVSALVAVCVLGFIDALVHAADAWASMPAGLVLSAIVAVLAMVATALRIYTSGAGGAT